VKELSEISSRYVPRAHTFDRVLVVFSDIEMGFGGPMDDFPHSDYLADLIGEYNSRLFKGKNVDLVFNGDTFDLLKTDYEGKFPHHIDRNVALGKFAKVAAAHPKFFEGVRSFIEFEPKKRRVIFICGNHDFELFFPEVQAVLKSLITSLPGTVHFPGMSFNQGPVKIEHGSQYDSLFRFDEKKPFVGHNGSKLLNIPWASVALLDVYMPLKEKLFHLDRLKPKQKVLEILPDLKEVMSTRLSKYYTGDYLRNFLLSPDPLKKVSWTMFKEIIRRFYTQDADVNMDMQLHKILKTPGPTQIFLVGHQHETGLWSMGNRKVIRTGCFRNEFMIEADGKSLTNIPKNFAEVFMKGNQVVRSHLVEETGPEVPKGYIPMEIREYRPILKKLLGTHAERETKIKEVQKLDQIEKKEPPKTTSNPQDKQPPLKKSSKTNEDYFLTD